MIKHSQRRAQHVARQLREEGCEVRYRHDWKAFSGTIAEMPIEPTVQDLIDSANSAIEYAQSVRRLHARKSKRGSLQRETDIKQALERIRKAMRPIRRQVGRIPYENFHSGAAELKRASEGMQRERRKLWKMKGPKIKQKPGPKPKIPKTYPKPKFNLEDHR